MIKTIDKTLFGHPDETRFVPESELIKVIQYFEENIEDIDPLWQFRSLKIYINWRIKRSDDRRTFLARFIDEVSDEILETLPINNTKYSDWSFSLSYVLMYFYFIYEYFYNAKSEEYNSIKLSFL